MNTPAGTIVHCESFKHQPSDGWSVSPDRIGIMAVDRKVPLVLEEEEGVYLDTLLEFAPAEGVLTLDI